MRAARSAAIASSTSVAAREPYEPLFAPHAASYVGVDPVDNPKADLKGPVEDLPVEDATFDVVLCNQVLEHCDDPVKAVSRAATASPRRAAACSPPRTA